MAKCTKGAKKQFGLCTMDLKRLSLTISYLKKQQLKSRTLLSKLYTVYNHFFSYSKDFILLITKWMQTVLHASIIVFSDNSPLGHLSVET